MITDSGEVLTAPSDIKREAVLHFQRFLQTDVQRGAVVTVEAIQDLLSYRCLAAHTGKLQAPVTDSEVISASRSLPNDKVPGPDGYTKEIYIASWTVLGKDFVTAVQSFFLYGFMPKGVNSTILALIPKTENAERMKDFRPIACCNLLYKVFSIILANRLKAILSDAIEPNQSAFIKGRLLLENVILASELVNGYHKAFVSAWCSIKFDISKAFHMVK